MTEHALLTVPQRLKVQLNSEALWVDFDLSELEWGSKLLARFLRMFQCHVEHLTVPVNESVLDQNLHYALDTVLRFRYGVFCV